MTFKHFAENVNVRFNEMSKGELFTTDLGDDIFEQYLSFFPEGTNPHYRERTEHDCNCCKNFIRRIGSLVSIENGKVISVWHDHKQAEYPYNIVGEKMNELVRNAGIVSVFRTKERQYGAKETPDNHENKMWNHFWGVVNARHFNSKPDEARGHINSTVQVFARGMAELTVSSFNTVLDLINNDGLYRGAEHKATVQNLLNLKLEYDKAPDKGIFMWENFNLPAARGRNTVIGTLLVDISEGVDLEKAVRTFEAKVAPHNYKRPTAVITQKMVEDASAKLKELNLESAIHRRHATMRDMSVNNVLFVDNKAREKMKDGIAGLLADSVKTPEHKIHSSQDIRIEEFVSLALPNAIGIKVLLKNSQLSKFVSMTGSDGDERPFKWNNNFAWAYDGDVTDSIKERVKAAGGRVENAQLRVSLAWFNTDDLDLHCISPQEGHIYYGTKKNVLDVDMNVGGESTSPVENMSWVSTPKDGTYTFRVDMFTKRNTDNIGYTLEVECAGQIWVYNSNAGPVRAANDLEIVMKGGKVESIKARHGLTSSTRSQEKWGVKTETLVDVDAVLLSPNHWDGQDIGSRHWFFILKDCKNPDPVRGIFNEYLRPEFEQHRKVFEVLGSKTKCAFSEEQLSGVGFTKGRNNTLQVIVEYTGFTKTYNIIF